MRHEYKSGYCKNHFNAILLTKLRDDIIEAIKNSSFYKSDYSKAFDTFDFSILIKKIHLIFVNDFYTGFLVIEQTDDILYKSIQVCLIFYIQILLYHKVLFETSSLFLMCS